MGTKKWLGKRLVNFLLSWRKSLSQRHKELVTASGVTICVLLLRSFGLLQFSEWVALDQLFQLRPYESPENRITIVAIDEASLDNAGTWPIPDNVIAQLLQRINTYHPRAVGLDIYRNLPVGPGYKDLHRIYKSMPNLVGIELLANNKNTRVLPPDTLRHNNQVGFSNVLLDADGKVRRSLLYWHIDNQVHESFALKLALLYLQPEGITPKRAKSHPNYLQLGKAIFRRFQPYDGAYVGADSRGYQILSNLPKFACYQPSHCAFRQVSLKDALVGKISQDWIKDQIVLIGSTAPSVQDLFLIPYSGKIGSAIQPIAGIQLQAYFISELITAALQGRPLLRVWHDLIECLWIFAWGCLGSTMPWQSRLPSKSCLNFIFACLLLFIIAYLAFLLGWWIPTVPTLLAFSGSAVTVTYQIAYRQEELRRSKEFLHQVINTIPDPVFVKNEKHQWIVLNEAYCRFLGYPMHDLIEKSDFDFFPPHEADVFRHQDEQVFKTQEPQEHEEEFTNASGKTYVIATKRSLHKDAAGNFFLVGVIRDITERKIMEEELKRAAAELFRSNHELKLKEDRLRYLAYHDPLTGLPNRKYFVEQLHESLLWAENNNLLLGLLFIDLDGFKQVNDTLGHQIGDHLLVTISQRLHNSLHGGDTVARLGGDEFIIILRAIPKIQIAAKIADQILATIAEPIMIDGHTIIVSASIGISVYPMNSQDSAVLIKQADIAMYRAKHLGKNRYEFA